MFVIAEKNGRIRKFTKLSWENLGSNTQGWKEVTETNQVAKNEVEAPETGDKVSVKTPAAEQVAKNEAETSQPDQVAKNEVETAKEEATKTETPAENDVDEFYALAKSLKRVTIKDFLDMNQVAYKQNDNVDTLIEAVRKKLENNVESLKAEFGL